MNTLYPLRFEPTFRRYLWGGRKLGSVLEKPIGQGDDYAESWEVVDHGSDQSIVAFGSLAGQTLGDLVRNHAAELFGQLGPFERFPLLFKFLDANRDLSVQVHPNDRQGSRLDPPDLGKTEAWVILDAEPGSRVYAGLKQGINRKQLAEEVVRGATGVCLHQFHPTSGDCIFIPAGVVHALGAGLLVAEIQQSSDTTFRLYDWNRVGTDGQPRQLHIEQALDTIDYQIGPVDPQTPKTTEQTDRYRLVTCDKFVLDRWQVEDSVSVGGDNRFHILAILEGRITVPDDPAGQPLGKGQTIILPASWDAQMIQVDGNSVILDMYLPTADELPQ